MPKVESELDAAGMARRESRLVYTFLALLTVLVAHFVRYEWYDMHIVATTQKVRQMESAPDAYRVLFPLIWRPLYLMTNYRFMPEMAAGLDAIFLFATLVVLYHLLLRLTTPLWPERTAEVGFFLASLPFGLVWIVGFQRQVTTPSALLVAVALLALTWEGERTCLLVLSALAVVQGFLRADTGIVFGLSLVSASLVLRWPWRKYLLGGLLVLGISGGIQAYLEFVRFPNAHYSEETPMFFFPHNLEPHRLEHFFVSMLPVAVLLWFGRRVRLQREEILILVFTVLYAILWCIVGAIDEVRIMVPCLLPLAVVAGRLAGRYWVGNSGALLPE